MARVTGIGGVFLRSRDPKAMAKWYAEHLGVRLSDFNGAAFSWSDEVPEGTGMTAWSTFPQDTSYFGEPQADAAGRAPQAVMVNYRVDDLDGLLRSLSDSGVWIDPKREDYSYGRFAWIRDCDGNRVELWQPLVSSDAS
jgi:predicted enzyme related to lactoylglutathione lyase